MNKSVMIDDSKKNFAMQYLLDFNVPEAAKRCGITRNTAYTWLKEDCVSDFITKNQAKVAQKINITQEQVINELAKIALFKHDYMQDLALDVEEGNIGVKLEEYQNIDFSAIQSCNVKTDKSGIPFIEIKPYNKVEALKELNEWFKKSKIAEEVHIHLSMDDLKGLSAQEITREYHEIVQNAALPPVEPAEYKDVSP